MTSIKQNSGTPSSAAPQAAPVTLPDFCNLGVWLRILVIVDGMTVVAAVLKSSSYSGMGVEWMEISVVVQPILLLSLLTLCLGRRFFAGLPYRLGIAAVVATELALTAVVHAVNRRLFDFEVGGPLERQWFFTVLVSGVLLIYFHLRCRAFSPAIAEARLQALQARIRPHFLFNSINAVLSLVRSEPRRAERALEDLADLFRVLMADNRQLTPLEREVQLCRQYLELEQLRLGDRLKVAWHIDKMPRDALVPPLMLQPLLENAVYHGIEPCSEAGEIHINIYRARSQVHCVLTNPYRREGGHHAGNKMALANVRERLQLHFDAEASLSTKVNAATYQVHIVLPYTVAEHG
jgi:two-component system sensor histidine kinase AlgZ